MVWHQKTVCSQGGEPNLGKEGGKDWGVDGHLPVLADQGQIGEGRGFEKPPQSLRQKCCLVHFFTPYLK